ncbi:MAG: hypothetical protein ACYDHH_28695 [Solirubrobacteraceae bacterium]
MGLDDLTPPYLLPELKQQWAATVRTHFDNIYAKLGAHDRAATVATALRLGLID